MKATKRIGCALLVLIFLLLAGCAVPPQTKAGETMSDFVFGENGYEYAPIPYGSTREEAENALGAAMIEDGFSPHAEPFEYWSYQTPGQDVRIIGLLSRIDVQCTESDGLFAFTIHSAITPDQYEDFIDVFCGHYTDMFGEATVITNTPENASIYEWEDKESGTVFMIDIDGEATQSNGVILHSVRIGCFEKWRYVEAGVGEWARK